MLVGENLKYANKKENQIKSGSCINEMKVVGQQALGFKSLHEMLDI